MSEIDGYCEAIRDSPNITADIPGATKVANEGSSLW